MILSFSSSRSLSYLPSQCILSILLAKSTLSEFCISGIFQRMAGKTVWRLINISLILSLTSLLLNKSTSEKGLNVFFSGCSIFTSSLVMSCNKFQLRCLRSYHSWISISLIIFQLSLKFSILVFYLTSFRCLTYLA